MIKPNYILKLSCILFVLYCLIKSENVNYATIYPMLVVIAINIYYEKYNKSWYVLVLSLMAAGYCGYIDHGMGILLCIPVFDFAVKKSLPGIILTLICEGVTLGGFTEYEYILFVTALCAFFGWIINITLEKEADFKELFDHERSLRYELERAKVRLLNYANEAARLAEAQERNRIAREIHDTVGHRITGVLIQLQAVRKLFAKNDERTKEALELSIRTLSETVDIMRETVHNIKPHEPLGVEYIKNIISNFKFCQVDFNFTGDFAYLPPNQLEIIGANIMESLTNAERYSGATQIDIFLDIGDLFTRLCIKDNGKGCNKIKMGLGLGGMRERVENAGGNLTISSTNGFSIVTIIPATNKKGGAFYENTNC